jgi:hypothetical protein
MDNDILTIPDLIPKSYQDEIEHEMTSLMFPWSYKHDVSGQPNHPTVFTNDTNIVKRDAFIHLFYAAESNIVSPYFGLIKPLLYFLEEKSGFKTNNLLRMRAVLTYKDPSWDLENYLTPHIDDPLPHKTLIYYVNQCDGDTFFYKDFFVQGRENFNKRVLEKRMTPVKGTGVLFDGHRYHGNGVGRKHNRIVINMNFN